MKKAIGYLILTIAGLILFLAMWMLSNLYITFFIWLGSIITSFLLILALELIS